VWYLIHTHPELEILNNMLTKVFTTKLALTHPLGPVGGVYRWLKALALGSLSVALAALPGRSAEKVYLDYKPLNFNIVVPVASLEAFAADGTIDAYLQPVAGMFSPEARQEIRKVLGQPLKAITPDLPGKFYSPFVRSQWLYSSIGERSLLFLGNYIQTTGYLNGQKAIRSAMILSATEPEGPSLIKSLKYFPTEGIHLDLAKILTLVQDVKAEAARTDKVVATVKQMSQDAAAKEAKIDYAALTDLSQTGPYGVTKQSLMLQAPSRKGLDDKTPREFPADLYLPKDLNAVPGPLPVVVFSHGYADTRISFATFAESLASHGFVVAMPEHIGSNIAYREAMEAGFHGDSFQAMEFVNRPLDISFLLDELARKNVSEFQGRLQMDRVGVMGHSFGGYTALALAGATVDFDRVQRHCASDAKLSGTVSTAYLLECRVLELTDAPNVMRQLTDGSLRDPRVQLVMPFAPVSNLFGSTGMSKIQIPVAIMGGAHDIAAPVVPEQVDTFRWLTIPDKYLYLAENTSHTADLTRLTINLFNSGVETAKSFDDSHQWFQGVVKTLMIAHSRVYLLGQEDYRPYLTSAYVEAVSQEPQKLHLVRSLPEDIVP
jgi:predicted dienelactone hydrolase